MLEITKFKLIDAGRGGIIIEGHESVLLSSHYHVIDEIKRKRKLVLSVPIMEEIQKLKYFFLNCTGHWVPPFNKYYDTLTNKALPLEPDAEGKIKPGQEMLKDILNKTEITGVSFSAGGFVITGTVEAVEGKKVTISTPHITEEDDLGFFQNAISCIEECVHMVVNTFSSNVLPNVDPKTVLTEEEMQSLDMKELTNRVIEKLVDRNMIMLVKDEGPDALPENTDKKTSINTNTKSIDSHAVAEATTHSDDDEETAADKAIRENLNANNKNVFGKPASDSEMPDEFKATDKVSGKDLADLEHSENMGLGGEEQTSKETEEWAE